MRGGSPEALGLRVIPCRVWDHKTVPSTVTVSGMEGLRERKKAQTRRRIEETAVRLFAERGYDAVTVNEIAEAAGVAKVTLFTYFPTKESLVLGPVDNDDPAAVVAARRPGQTPIDALRAHFAAAPVDVDLEELTTRLRVIYETPALVAGVSRIHYLQRQSLARALDGAGDPVASLMAAQISAVLLTLQERFFERLSAGMALGEAGDRLSEDVELAFDLLERGFGDHYRR